MLTAPPLADALVTLSVWLLDRNRPPPAPPSALKVLAEVITTAPLVPIPFAAVRSSVLAVTLIALPFGAERAPPAVRVTVPRAEITPRVMLRAVV